jgi:hypothetical protein
MATFLEAVHARGGSILADYVRSPVRHEKDLLRFGGSSTAPRAAIAYAEIPGEDDWSWPASTALHLGYAPPPAQIGAVPRTGAILFATDRTGERLGSFYRCPWLAVYEVRRPVTIGGTPLLPMQHFTFDVLGEA